MTPPPANPRVYHITHVQNLPAIIRSGGLLSDAAMLARGGPTATIGMQTIKQRRLSLPVKCHPGLYVGDCVPFYLCPRSIMLFVIHCANHPQLTYRGGQGPIVHLEANLNAVVQWADAQPRRWAFSLSNAGSSYTRFENNLARLAELDWVAIAASDFRKGALSPTGREVSEGKQAEFLLEGDFPWSLVQRVGVASHPLAAQVHAALAGAAHVPQVSIEPTWYF